MLPCGQQQAEAYHKIIVDICQHVNGNKLDIVDH